MPIVKTKENKTALVNFLQEYGMLAHLPRSGFAFLGTGDQSVADHTCRMLAIALVLAKLVKEPVDELKLLKLCLFHDLPESRIGDHNYVQKRYVSADMDKVLKDIHEASPLGPNIVEMIEEFEEQKTLEARLARDADHLELLLVLKRELDTGNPQAADWFEVSQKRLKSPEAQELARQIRATPYDAWWRGLQ